MLERSHPTGLDYFDRIKKETDMNQPVYVLGGYQSDFAKSWARNGEDISDMTRQATLGAIHACQ